jgi:hypothetical protein
MTRLYVVSEGQTEVSFVERILKPISRKGAARRSW